MLRLFAKHRFILTAVWSLGFVFLAANLALAGIYNDRIYPGVKLAQLNLGNLNRADAIVAIQRQINAYNLKLKIDDKTVSLRPAQLGATYEANLVVDEALRRGHDAWLPVIGFFTASRGPKLTYAYSVSHKQLTEFINSLSLKQVEAPVDAQVVVNNGVPQVKPDHDGLGVDAKKLAATIESSLGDQIAELTVVRQPVTADVTAEAVLPALDVAKNLIATKLTLNYQDKVFHPSSADIGSWLDFPKDGNHLDPTTNRDRVLAYINSAIASNIDVAAKNHVINLVNGEAKSDEPGANGLAVDQASLADQIIAALGKGSASIAVPTGPVAFKTLYNKTIAIGAGRWVEVNLTLQHLWAYQDGTAVFDSPVTSGATGAGFGTVQGLFSIYTKERNRYLDGRPLGYNYNVFVQYWMPFYADFGLHDASWRSAFGGPDYYYNGSHGCVNLPLATAAWLWDFTSVGTPVWVHS